MLIELKDIINLNYIMDNITNNIGVLAFIAISGFAVYKFFDLTDRRPLIIKQNPVSSYGYDNRYYTPHHRFHRR